MGAVLDMVVNGSLLFNFFYDQIKKQTTVSLECVMMTHDFARIALTMNLHGGREWNSEGREN